MQMPEMNRKQAYLPRSATKISNPVGSAPGVYWERQASHIFLLPGVPEEMRAMLDETVIPSLQALIPEARLNGDRDKRLSNTLNLTLPDLRGESLVVSLDQHGISLSSGSACKAGSPDPTHVLMAMGKTAEEAHCSVRFSLSHDTTSEEIEKTAAALDHVLEEMETTVRFLPCK